MPFSLCSYVFFIRELLQVGISYNFSASSLLARYFNGSLCKTSIFATPGVCVVENLREEEAHSQSARYELLFIKTKPQFSSICFFETFQKIVMR